MDILAIEQLKIETTIGLFDWERQIKQALYFDLQWSADVAKVAQTDHLSQTVDYSIVAAGLQEFVEGSSFFLIETLAEKSAEYLLERFEFQWLKLKLTKPGIIHDAKNVSVTIERCFNFTHDRELCDGNDNSK